MMKDDFNLPELDEPNGTASKTELPLRKVTIARAKRRQKQKAGMASTPLFQDQDEVDQADSESIRWKSQTPSRIRKVLRSALFWVGLPTLFSGAYFGLIATDQFASSASFAIRAQNPVAPSATTLAVAMGGIGGNTDMFIVNGYIQSHQILEDLRPLVDVRKIFSNPKADWWARLDPTVPDEQLLEYWKKMVTVHYDLASGLSTLQVRTFDPKDSKEIADHVLHLSEALVNRLSERSRSDALQLAEKEVQKAYDRVMKSIDALRSYAEKNKQVDPSMAVRTKSEIQGQLESELITHQSQLAVLSKSLPSNAPGIVRLNDLIDVIEKKLAHEKARSTSSENGDSAADVMSGFAKLNLEREFSEKAYHSSLASMETARIETMRQGQYVESFVRPQLATYAEYPERLKNVLLTAAGAALLWAIGSLLVAATLEHL